MNTLAARDSQALTRELNSGEKLIWAGHPDAGRAARATIGIFLFAIPWTGFAIFWVTMAFWGVSHMAHSPGPVAYLFPLFGTPFVLIGLGLLSSPFWAYSKAKNTHYAVTNKRIMIVTSGKTKTVQHYEFANLVNLTRTEYGTRGDLVWTVANPGVDLSLSRGISRGQGFNQGGVNYVNGAAGNSVSFIGIEKPRDVERLIEEQAKKQQSGDN